MPYRIVVEGHDDIMNLEGMLPDEAAICAVQGLFEPDGALPAEPLHVEVYADGADVLVGTYRVSVAVRHDPTLGGGVQARVVATAVEV